LYPRAQGCGDFGAEGTGIRKKSKGEVLQHKPWSIPSLRFREITLMI